MSDPVTIVDDVVVGEHRALGKAGRTRGVLDIDDLMNIEPDAGKKIGRGGFSHVLDLGVGHHAGRRSLSHKNHVTQARKLGAREFRALAVAAQFRRYLVDDFGILNIPEPL